MPNRSSGFLHEMHPIKNKIGFDPESRLWQSGVNFINVFHKDFMRADPKCAKKDSLVSSVVLHFWDLQA
jgi:hypothetical protein